MNQQLQTGHGYTIISITWMHTTHRLEIFITGHNPSIRTYFYREAGNGKILPLTQDELDRSLVFEDHCIPFLTATDTNRIIGNGRFNFVTNDPVTLKAYIQECCLNPHPDNFRKILYHRPCLLSTGDKAGAVLFPEHP